MNDWSPERRALAAVGLVALGIVIGFALDGGSDRTVIVTGEGVITVVGTISDLRLPEASGGGLRASRSTRRS